VPPRLAETIVVRSPANSGRREESIAPPQVSGQRTPDFRIRSGKMAHSIVVVSFVRGEWSAGVEGEPGQHAFPERYPALEWAHRWAQANRPALVRVFREDGFVEDEWAYGAVKGIRHHDPAARAGAP
jgi:hypothetical protein